MKRIFKKLVAAILLFESKLVVRKYSPKIIAVVGSVGKTSAKDAIYAALSQSVHVRKSDKSFNSELGLPLTILGCPNAWQNPLRWMQNIIDGLFLVVFPAQYPEWLVLEVGADRPGDIRSLGKWLPVDIVVITRLPEVPVHVEYFDSPEAVVEEKAAILDALRPGGVLVLFADDERTSALSERARATGARVITFGLSEHADVRGSDFTLLRPSTSLGTGEESKNGWPIGMSARIKAGGVGVPVSVLGTIGSHSMLPLLTTAAVGEALHKNLADIADALRYYDPPHGRMHLLHGVKETLIIDDTYNSSPAAVTAALDALHLVAPPGRTVAVLGDMLELGRHSVEEHRKVGVHAAEACDLLLTVGFRARDIAQGALDSGMNDSNIFQYEDAHKAGDELEAMLAPGDCILVKGSQSMRMERVVEEIMAEPERAGELLVRQEREWKKR